jgi:WD40 repeat protein
VEYRLTFYDPASGQTNVTTLRDQAPLASAAFSPNGVLVAAGAYDGTVRLWALENGESAGVLDLPEAAAAGDDGRVVRVAFSADSSRVAGLTAGGIAAVWEIESGMLVGRYTFDLANREGLEDLCYFALKDEALVLGWEGMTQIIDIENGSLSGAQSGWCGLPLAVTAEGLVEISGGLLALEGPGESYAQRKALAAAPADGRLAVGFSGSSGAQVQVWDFNLETPLLEASAQPLAANDAALLAVASHPDGTLSLANGDGHLKRYGLLSGSAQAAALELPFVAGDRASSFAFSPDGSLAAAGSYQGGVALWRNVFGQEGASAAQVLREGSASGAPVTALVFSSGCSGANGCQLAAAFENGRLLLWGADGAGPETFETAARLLGLSFAPDGSALAVVTDAGVDVLNLPGGAWGASFSGYAAQFNPAGALAVASGRGQIVLYDPESGTMAGELDSNSGSLAFSPDGKLLAVSGVQVELWDLGAEPLLKLASLPSFAPYGRITFSADGAFLIAAAWDGTMRVWGVP